MNCFKVKLGSWLNRLPYILFPKIGIRYIQYQNDIRAYLKTEDKKKWIFMKVYTIVEYAINNIPFYRDFYKSHGFNITDLKSYNDISRIPILHKSDLINVPLEVRSNLSLPHYLANTGGSTGAPFTFYRSPILRVKAMAFYHHAWLKLGYKKHKLRLQFVGHQDVEGCVYDFKRNQIRVSVYEPFDKVLKEIERVNSTCSIEYLQGYPSVIYEFALFCQKNMELYQASKLSETINGIFLSSEFPNPVYRKTIETFFNVETIASYGLSEGCALAFDYGQGIYDVIQSYSYVEAVESQDGIHVIGTSYDNYAAPLIRYDTNDIITDVVFDDSILRSFRMDTGGRAGQYIIDSNQKRISLTGMIFGKHHRLFDYCSQLQISQKQIGEATIYYVPKTILPPDFTPSSLFDSYGIDIKLKFEQIDEPIRTASGKVLLLVESLNT